MKTKYIIMLSLISCFLLITSVYAVGEIAKKRTLTIDTSVEIDENVFNELNAKGNLDSDKIIEKGIQELEQESMKDLVGEMNHQFFIMQNTRNYEGMRQTITLMKQLNEGK